MAIYRQMVVNYIFSQMFYSGRTQRLSGRTQQHYSTCYTSPSFGELFTYQSRTLQTLLISLLRGVLNNCVNLLHTGNFGMYE